MISNAVSPLNLAFQQPMLHKLIQKERYRLIRCCAAMFYNSYGSLNIALTFLPLPFLLPHPYNVPFYADQVNAPCILQHLDILFLWPNCSINFFWRPWQPSGVKSVFIPKRQVNLFAFISVNLQILCEQQKSDRWQALLLIGRVIIVIS